MPVNEQTSRWCVRLRGLRGNVPPELEVVRVWGFTHYTVLAEGTYEACCAARRLMEGCALFGMRGDF